MNNPLSRRRFVQMSAAAATLAGSKGLYAAGEEQVDARRSGSRAMRFVHLTDIHVQPELRAEEGLVKCLKAIERLDPRPDFILTGGDLVMDVFEQEETRARSLFTLLRQVFGDHTSLPVYHCIGNHDVFAWDSPAVPKDHPQHGKVMVQEYLGLPNRYYKFDRHGWRFYVLDDIQPADNNAYQAYIDEQQMAWLEEELRAKPAEMPAVAVSHIPILTVTAFGGYEEGAHRVPASVMCRDMNRLVTLFAAHNVRLALSGHLHQLDRVDFRGVTFICDGAVSGAWWKGNNKGFEEGFGIIDLNTDGSIQHRYFDYGWDPSAL